MIGFFEPDWNALAPFRTVVDAFIPFEGESPLLALLRGLEANKPLQILPGVISYLDGRAVFNVPPSPPTLEELPLPNFDGLPVKRYLAPKPILPYLTSRGCYWAKCAFCSHHQLYRAHFRRKSAQQVIRELTTLVQRYPGAEFYLVDEAIPPATARQIADQISGCGLRLRWFGEMRLERGLDDDVLADLAKGGCSLLMFGLESAAPRVLHRMHKGIDPEHTARILSASARNGIRTFVMFMTGFPTETHIEAEQTIAFIAAHSNDIDDIAFTNFILEKHSPVFKNPVAYGIRPAKTSAEDDLKIYSDFEIESGLSTEEAIRFLDEAKTQPEMHRIIERYIFSRAHLAYLGKRGTAGERGMSADPTVCPDWSRPDILFPLRHDGLVPLELPYCLDDLKSGPGSRASGPDITRRLTNYVYDPESERMIEVGEDGLALLQACDGRRSLREILDLIGEQNGKEALRYYTGLTDVGFLSWSAHRCALS